MWDARVDTTRELRRRVAENRYQVDPDAVAHSMLSRLAAARHGMGGRDAGLGAALEGAEPLLEH